MAEALALASGIAGLVSLTVQVTQISLQFVGDVRGASSSQCCYLQELAALTSTLLRMQRIVNDTATQPLLAAHSNRIQASAIDDCVTQLEEIKTKLEKHATRTGTLSKLKALKWPFQEKDTRRMVDMLHRYHDIFASTLLVDNITLAMGTYTEVTAAKQDSRLKELLAWLSPVKYVESHRPRISLQNTGRWCLTHEKYLSWRDGSESLLWAFGPPGSGKTVLTSIIFDDLQDWRAPKDNIMALFLTTDEAQTQGASDVLRDILTQCLATANCVPDEIFALRERFRNARTGPPPKDLVKCILLAAQKWSRNVLLVDGLDEFEDRIILMNTLNSFRQKGFKIYISSRDIADIRSAFSQPCSICVKASEDDLKCFVKSQLDESDSGSLLRSTGLYDTIVHKVVNHVDGIFLLARLIMDNMSTCTNLKQVRRCLESLPVDLSLAYQDTINRIKRQSPVRRQLAAKILMWILHSKRPLSMLELQHALAVEENTQTFDLENVDTAEIILSVCLGLISEDRVHGVVRLLHATTHEFLRACGDPLIVGGRKLIAETCLTYLAYKDLETGSCVSLRKFNDRREALPLLTYLARFWGDHVQPEEAHLHDQLLTFVNHDGLRSSATQALHFQVKKDAELTEALFVSIPSGLQPLHVVAFWGLVLIARHLIDNGAEVNVVDDQGWIPLHWACSRGQEDIAQLLISSGSEIDKGDKYGWTPLFWAVVKGHKHIVLLLLQSGADRLPRDISGWSALHWATCVGNDKIVAYLLAESEQGSITRANGKPRMTTVELNHITVARAKELHRSRSSEGYDRSNLDGVPGQDLGPPPVPFELAAEKEDHETFQRLIGDGVAREEKGDSLYFNPLGNNFWESEPPVSDLWRALSKADWAYLANDFSDRNLSKSVEFPLKLLNRAIKDEKLMVVKALVESGTSIEASQRQWRGRTPLHRAAYNRRPDIVEYLVVNGANKNAADNEGQTPLHIAAKFGYEGVVELLSASETSVNLQDNNGKTPLHHLCALGRWRSKLDATANVRIAKLLLGRGADVSIRDSDGCTPLHYAVSHCDTALLEMLLTAGASANDKDKFGLSPLHHLVSQHGKMYWQEDWDVSYEQQRAVFELLVQNSDPGTCSSECATSEYRFSVRRGFPGKDCPLSLAIDSENWDLFDMLEDSGATWTSGQPRGETLLTAASEGRARPIKTLLAAGVDVNFKSSYSGPAIHNVIQSCGCTENWLAFDLLVAAGCDLYATDRNGLSPLQFAVQSSNMSALEKLLRAGVSPFYLEPALSDPFLLATLSSNTGCLTVLLQYAKDHGSRRSWIEVPGDHVVSDPAENVRLICSRLKAIDSLNITDAAKHTLLIRAAQSQCLITVEQLLAAGANPELADESGWKALHVAVQHGYTDIVEALLDTGVSVEDAAKSYNPGQPPHGKEIYWRPLHIATAFHFADIVELLLLHGADVNVRMLRDGIEQTALQSAARHSHVDVAQILVDRGAEITNVPCPFSLDDILKYEGHEDLWDRLRAEINVERSIQIEC